MTSSPALSPFCHLATFTEGEELRKDSHYNPSLPSPFYLLSIPDLGTQRDSPGIRQYYGDFSFPLQWFAASCLVCSVGLEMSVVCGADIDLEL